MPPGSPDPTLRGAVAAIAGAVALALLLVAPVLADPAGRALGHPEVDTWNHVWGYHHVARAIGALESPLRVSELAWPLGGSLWFIDAFGAVATLPLQWAFGPVFAYNAAIFGNLVLSGAAAWALARHVAGPRAAAVSLVAYEAMPHVLGQIYDGISETAAAGWLPLSILAALLFRRRPTLRRALVAGVALGVCALTNWYYGLFALMATLPIAGAAALRGGPARARLPWAALAAAAIAAPAALAFRWTLRAPDALVRRDPDLVARTLEGHNMVDLESFFRPGDFHSPDLLALYDERMISVAYVGWALLLLAALALRRDPRSRPWVAGAALAFAMALGAWLFLGGAYVEIAGGRVPLPFGLLFRHLPISHPLRFVVPGVLFLGVAAALGLARSSRPAVAVAALAVLVESLALSPARVPLPVARADVPAVYGRIDVPGAVIDLPASLQVLARSRYDLFATAHGRPIPYGLNDPTPAFLAENLLTRTVFELERTSVDSPPTAPPHLELAWARRELRAAGFAAVVVHRDLYPPAMSDRVLAFLEVALGPGEMVEDAALFRP